MQRKSPKRRGEKPYKGILLVFYFVFCPIMLTFVTKYETFIIPFIMD